MESSLCNDSILEVHIAIQACRSYKDQSKKNAWSKKEKGGPVGVFMNGAFPV